MAAFMLAVGSPLTSYPAVDGVWKCCLVHAASLLTTTHAVQTVIGNTNISFAARVHVCVCVVSVPLCQYDIKKKKKILELLK